MSNRARIFLQLAAYGAVLGAIALVLVHVASLLDPLFR